MAALKKILVIHGPNLHLLGTREKQVYGSATLASINQQLKAEAKQAKVALTFFQSNHEGEIVDRIGKAPRAYHGILINPAAYTHTSVAIRDALLAVNLPAVEVHLSNIYKREDFRQKSLSAPACSGQVAGFGADSYRLGLLGLIQVIAQIPTSAPVRGAKRKR